MKPDPRMRHSRFWVDREPPRVMYPGELVAVLNKHRHPRYHSCGVMQTRWGERPRRDAGIVPSGTIWFANYQGFDDVLTIPADQIPYTTHRPKLEHWDEVAGRWKAGEQILRGWRGAIAQLTRAGCLRPSAELSYLIGEDTRTLVPKRYRLS